MRDPPITDKDCWSLKIRQSGSQLCYLIIFINFFNEYITSLTQRKNFRFHAPMLSSINPRFQGYANVAGGLSGLMNAAASASNAGAAGSGVTFPLQRVGNLTIYGNTASPR